MIVRPAAADDAAGINAVYNPYIKESPATFETAAWTDVMRTDWIAARTADPRGAVVVANDASGSVLGFASAAPFDPRPAYETSVKTSVFLRPGATGRGVGRALYEALFNALDGADLHRAYGLVVAPNPASKALHERMGFVHVATLNEVGRKFGRYHDVMWFEKRLAGSTGPGA